MNNERSLAKEITEGFEALKSMRNNEPVAWMGIRRNGETRVSVEKLDKDDIPLYIHPVKEITDEEIVSIYESSYLQSGLDEWEFDPVYFARAILRKAQDK
jgi:D-alanine-D-alanine ligase-like ATP-grasp enzyme